METNQAKTYTITAALPYANGPIHIGHLAGAYLPADIYARYLRQQGHDVAFICGSDEGGVAILLKARAEGKAPQEIVDTYHARNKEAFKRIGISFDIFSRTSNPKHHEVASAFFTKMYEENQFVLQEKAQFYDPKEQLFLADRYIQGTCPNCTYMAAYGDQCESCGTSLSPDELIEPHSKLSGATPIRKKTKHWYLPLDKHEEWLKQWILEEHTEWKPNVYGQCKSWLTQGLRPRAITRDLDWGISVPLKEFAEKVLYVWFEAPIGYISATQEWAATNGKDWRTYWQEPTTELIHFAGKDNVVFHCIIFPAMLRAHGGYILPKNVPANEFMNLEGDKISTSRNHAVWLEDYLTTHVGKEDVLRYVLAANAPETKDSNFRWEDFKERNNKELVGILGNFVHRTLSLAQQYYGGKVPAPSQYLPIDQETIHCIQKLPLQIKEAMHAFKFRQGLQHLLQFARVGNKYLADTTPWKISVSNPARVATIIHTSIQIVAYIAHYSTPYLPFTAKKLLDMLQLPTNKNFLTKDFELIQATHQLKAPILLFEKIH